MGTNLGSFMLVLPLVVVIIAFTYGVIRALAHAWMGHRVKLALLEKYERDPELFKTSDDLSKLLASEYQAATKAPRQDYRLTGLLLILIGIACVIAGRIIALGSLAVGVYIGGVLCIILGVLITSTGFLLRALGRGAPALHAD